MSRVFVLGNAGVDLVLPMARLPLAGETVVADGFARAPGGKGLNQAVVAARAGAEVLFQARIGRDGDAAFLAASLSAERFAGLWLIPCDKPTDCSIVMVAADAENSIVSLCHAADAMTADDATGFAGRMQAQDWLVVQGNLSLAATCAACATARARGGRVLYNAAPLRWPAQDVLFHADIAVVNRIEACLFTSESDPVAAAQALQKLGPRCVIVTLGAAGCLWLDEAAHHQPALPVQAIDSTGAGDSFCGALVAALARGCAFDAAIQAAQAAAAVSVMRRGAFAALPSAPELRTS